MSASKPCLQPGFVDEVKGLLDKGYSPELPPMSAIGYRECIRVINGQMSEEQAKVEMRRVTRVFVRRQGNWFKEDDPNIHWFYAGEENLVELVEDLSVVTYPTLGWGAYNQVYVSANNFRRSETPGLGCARCDPGERRQLHRQPVYRHGGDRQTAGARRIPRGRDRAAGHIQRRRTSAGSASHSCSGA